MALTPQQLIGPCLDKIVDGASGRKYSKLKTDAKVSSAAHTSYSQKCLLLQQQGRVDCGQCRLSLCLTYRTCQADLTASCSRNQLGLHQPVQHQYLRLVILPMHGMVACMSPWL